MKGRRAAPSRPPGERVLIVTEDTQSSRRYLDAVRVEARLAEARAVIVPGDGTDPMSVLNTALDVARSPDGPFDLVFVVVDEDSHTTLAPALSRIQDLNRERDARLADGTLPGPPLVPVVSAPCFEYFLLLHFEYTRAEFARTGRASPCDEALKRLKTHLPDYEKSEGYAASLRERTRADYEKARYHAARSSRDAEQVGRLHPATELDVVVDVLLHLGAGKTLADFDWGERATRQAPRSA